MEQVQIDTILISNTRYFIFLTVFFFGVVGLFLALAVVVSSFLIGAIGIFAVFLSPVIFGKCLKERFLKNAALRFDFLSAKSMIIWFIL